MMSRALVFLLLFLCTPVMAQPVIPAADGVVVEVMESGSELLNLNANTPITLRKAFTLTKPDRVVLDVATVKSGKLALPKFYKGKLLKSIRSGQFDATTTRIVLDLNGPVSIVSSSSGQPLSIEIAAAGPIKTGKPSADLPVVVIDAGHGGQDPGAKGLHGTIEKDVTLNYAKALRNALNTTGRYRAVLTRDNDRFIMLHERVVLARKNKGDIFISMHADSNPRAEARGFSIYTLSETASDVEAAALADAENKVDIVAGLDLSTADPDVASILIDLTQRETMNKSSRLADAMVESFPARISKLDKTHRYAGFRVLKAPDIPSVLIELGFLTNAQDERQLLTKEYREIVVDSIIKGIDRYRAGE